MELLEDWSPFTSGVTTFHSMSIMRLNKHGGGHVIAMNSALDQKFQKENIWSSVHDLKLKQKWVLQQDNPKHKSKSAFPNLKS